MNELIKDRFAKLNYNELNELFECIPTHRSKILDNLIIEIGTELEKKEKQSKQKAINALLEQKEGLRMALNSVIKELEKLNNKK